MSDDNKPKKLSIFDKILATVLLIGLIPIAYNFPLIVTGGLKIVGKAAGSMKKAVVTGWNKGSR